MTLTLTDRRSILTQADSTTDWTGGGFGVTTSDFAESTGAVAGSLAATTGQTYYTMPTGSIDLSTTLVYVYSFNNALQDAWDASPPPQGLLLGDGTDRISFDMAGANRRVFNHLDGPTAWQCLVLDGAQASAMNTAGNTYVVAGSFAGLNLAAITQVGCSFDTNSKALGGGYNVAVDIIRYGNNGIRLTAGTTGARGTFSEIAVADRSTADQTAHGVFRALASIAFGVQAPLTFGDSGNATACYFQDSGKVVVFENRNIANGKYYFNVEGHATPVNLFILTSCTLTTAGPNVSVDMSNANIDTLTLTACQFIALANTITFASTGASGHNVTGCTFDGCGQIDAGAVTFTNNVVSNSTATSGALVAGGGDMDGTTITGYEGTADTSALIYNETGDPDGELDNMNITKGTASTHAIEFGTSSPTTMTLRGIDFSGYNATDAQNDSTLHILRTTATVTINLIGCTGNISFKTAGATVVLVVDPVALAVHVTDITDQADINGARVLAEVSSAAGGWPYADTVTITSASTTATVTHTTHGLSTNDYVVIKDAAEYAYNGVFQITVTGASAYTYTLPTTASSPATGTITATFAVISGTTDVNGDISASYSYGAAQPVTGRVRSATGAMPYKSSPFTGTISATAGLSVEVQLIRDG